MTRSTHSFTQPSISDKLTIRQDPSLWQRLLDFEIDDPSASFSFTDRLARENGWTLQKSLRAVFEYKRFLYLVCCTGQSLTPSDEIDQVWHLHLLYTRSYWLELCPIVLKRELHHGPTKGGAHERLRYRDQYALTLHLYQRAFGAKAPDDLWPPVHKRFSELRFRRVNLHRNWVLPKWFVR